MYNFGPAINYGPNDAGVSAFSIVIALLAILAGFWVLGTLYGFLADSTKANKDKEE